MDTYEDFLKLVDRYGIELDNNYLNSIVPNLKKKDNLKSDKVPGILKFLTGMEESPELPSKRKESEEVKFFREEGAEKTEPGIFSDILKAVGEFTEVDPDSMRDEDKLESKKESIEDKRNEKYLQDLLDFLQSGIDKGTEKSKQNSTTSKAYGEENFPLLENKDKLIALRNLGKGVSGAAKALEDATKKKTETVSGGKSDDTGKGGTDGGQGAAMGKASEVLADLTKGKDKDKDKEKSFMDKLLGKSDFLTETGLRMMRGEGLFPAVTEAAKTQKATDTAKETTALNTLLTKAKIADLTRVDKVVELAQEYASLFGKPGSEGYSKAYESALNRLIDDQADDDSGIGDVKDVLNLLVSRNLIQQLGGESTFQKLAEDAGLPELAGGIPELSGPPKGGNNQVIIEDIN